MASLFTSKQGKGRPRAISNGGLGGFSQPHIAELTSREPVETGTWPRRRKQRPPPLKICYGSDELLVPAPQRSALWQNSKSPWSPSTPTSYASDTARLVVMGDSSATCSTPLSRFNNSVVTQSIPPSRSATPIKLPSEPVELPGSLLLPSQGLEPPPFTPPRPHHLTRRDTDDSDFSSAPSLISSTSSSFSDMDRFRSWKPAVGTSVTPTATTSVSKPFSTMSVEELFEALPKCNTFAIMQLWLPAMQSKYDALKFRLRNSAERKDKSTEELTNTGKDLLVFAEEARSISNTYTNALKSAESLLERDTNDLEKGLRIYEGKFREEKSKVEASNKTIREKDDAINRLESTLRGVVKVLGIFIQENISQWVTSFHDPGTQAVMQVIADYSDLISETSTCYVRIPEDKYTKTLASLRDAQANVEKYRTVVISQDSIIKEQSNQSDRHTQKVEKCLLKVKEQNHEVLLLGEKREELEKKVAEYEIALRRSESTVLERERLEKRNYELVQQLAAVQKDVEQRDLQILELRSQLGSAREEVLARKADVRNVIVQSQAMLVPTEVSNISSQSSGTRVRKVLGRGKDKPRSRQPLFPHSQSGINLGFGRPLNPDLMSSPPDSKYSSKEVVSKRKKPFDAVSSTTSTSTSFHSQDSNDGTRLEDPFHDTCPRADSTGALDAIRAIVQSPRANTQKQLPTPPPAIVATPPPNHPPQASPHGNGSTPKSFNCRDVPTYSDYGPQQTTRRILSDIPEASTEDAESPRTPSATSSDREIYRRSVHALNALGTFEDTNGPENAATEGTWANIERVESHGSDGSEPQTVSQMYHDGGQGHLRS